MREWPSNSGAFPSPFDDFFTRFFDDSGFARMTPARRRSAVDITEYFSEATDQIVRRAVQLAQGRNSSLVTPEHLLEAALADSVVQRMLQELGTDGTQVAAELARLRPETTGSIDNNPQFTAGAKRVLISAFQTARELGASYIGPEHVLLGIALDTESVAGSVLARAGLSLAKLETRSMATNTGVAREQGAAVASKTPTIDQYSVDFTRLAREGKFDPVIGRAQEIEQAIEILSRRTKNNPVLIGEPGVGKTAIVEGIAQRVASGDVPETIAGRRLLALDLSGVIAGTQYRGQFEERLKQIIDEIKANADSLLVFIDELHTVVGAGGAEGSLDAGNMLKPALARGELHVIGATTLDEYRKHVERDAALERRFQPVLVHEPTVDEAIAILHGLRDRYEAFHRVRIGDDAIVAAVELSDRYVRDRFLPDKAVDLIDQAAARVRLRSKTKPEDRQTQEADLARLERERDQAIAAEDFERAMLLRDQIRTLQGQLGTTANSGANAGEPVVTAEDIADVVARATGIPVSQLNQAERERLLKLEEHLHQRVIGQEEGVSAVAEAVRRARSGLGDPNRPIGSFLFLGPTGVGKTELARALADALFGDEEQVIRLDMSEFQERHTVSRLVGSPPGYVGYEEAGQLTEAVRRKPYAVVLLDEIEKAHPDVFNTLLQLLDDGRLTDGHGRTVDFKNTIVIMTSNLGSERITALSDRNDDDQELRDDLLALLRQRMRPEFINRIDEIVVFRALTEEQVQQIAGLMLDRVYHRMRAQGIDVNFTLAATAVVAKAGFDPDFGARPLKRAVQRLVENELARMVLDSKLTVGDAIVVDGANGQLDFRITPQSVAVSSR